MWVTSLKTEFLGSGAFRRILFDDRAVSSGSRGLLSNYITQRAERLPGTKQCGGVERSRHDVYRGAGGACR